MIVAIDGPAGAGKSSAARALAMRLGFRFLDTGAMYRAVAWAGAEHGVDWSKGDELAELARRIRLDAREDAILVDNRDVTRDIRTPQVTANTHFAANNASVRRHLVELQRAIAGGNNVVAEGRDQGTVVFPHAECKIFLTASAVERARRRVEELRSRGEEATLEQVLADQNCRDERDATRDVGPLVKAADAIELVTDGLTHDQVVDQLEALVRGRMAVGTSSAARRQI